MGGNQEDLRRLMREKMSSSGSEHQSPYKKVSSSGKIICTICPGVSIKNWATHQISAQHKRSINAEKAAKAMPPPPRNVLDRPPPTAKAGPPGGNSDPPKVAPKSILKNPLKSATASTGGQSSKAVESTETIKRPALSTEDQPETKKARAGVRAEQERTKDPAEATVPGSTFEQSDSGSGAQLPEGFFDDPKLDAKARNIEYRDPQEMEWEMFQKELREEGVKSEQVNTAVRDRGYSSIERYYIDKQSIIEVYSICAVSDHVRMQFCAKNHLISSLYLLQVVENDEENETREMELREADTMISHWEAIRELEIKKEQRKTAKVSVEQKPMDEDDEAEFAEFLDWRQKAVE